MLRKTILLLIFSSIIIAGFAQKSKRKTNTTIPKSSYFVMLINGETTPASIYCPGDSITFDFFVSDTNIIYTFCWWDNFHDTIGCNITPIKIAFPLWYNASYPNNISYYDVRLYVEISTDSVPVLDTLTTRIFIDYFRTILDTTVCQGRNITISTITHGDIIFTDVQKDEFTPWDTLQSASGCDSLVRWQIKMNPYIVEEYNISSCDSVIWVDKILKRPDNVTGDYTDMIQHIFKTEEQDVCCCDTLKILIVTIIDEPQLILTFDQNAFCKGEDMQGIIELETNFTAFDWIYYKDKKKERDSTWTDIEITNIEIDNPGFYYVTAYMDTSLYVILTDLRIVNCSLPADTLVEDCPLIIPDVITPNGDGVNDVLGIKKLNLERENELTIYDRWGKSVFHQKNYQCVFKGGTYHNIEEAFAGLSRGGQKLPDGTYYYAFMYDAFPKKKVYSGTIVILR